MSASGSGNQTAISTHPSRCHCQLCIGALGNRTHQHQHHTIPQAHPCGCQCHHHGMNASSRYGQHKLVQVHSLKCPCRQATNQQMHRTHNNTNTNTTTTHPLHCACFVCAQNPQHHRSNITLPRPHNDTGLQLLLHPPNLAKRLDAASPDQHNTPHSTVTAISLAAAALALALVATAALLCYTRRTAKPKLHALPRRDLEATAATGPTPHPARLPASEMLYGGDLGSCRPFGCSTSTTTHISNSRHSRTLCQSVMRGTASSSSSPGWTEGRLSYVEIDLADMRPQRGADGK